MHTPRLCGWPCPPFPIAATESSIFTTRHSHALSRESSRLLPRTNPVPQKVNPHPHHKNPAHRTSARSHGCSVQVQEKHPLPHAIAPLSAPITHTRAHTHGFSRPLCAIFRTLLSPPAHPEIGPCHPAQFTPFFALSSPQPSPSTQPPHLSPPMFLVVLAEVSAGFVPLEHGSHGFSGCLAALHPRCRVALRRCVI